MGTVNNSWYQLGFKHTTLSMPTQPATYTAHPDCGKKVTGTQIPDIAGILKVATDAHRKCCPNVPLCGWDVSLTTEGIFLLEVNLSCNFFQASVDFDKYFHFVDDQFMYIESLAGSQMPS